MIRRISYLRYFYIFFLTLILVILTSTTNTDALNFSENVLGKVWGCGDIYRELQLTNPPQSGDDILELEQRLMQLGFDPGNVDGVFDRQTQAAVQMFQKGKKLKPSGVVTMSTWEALGENCERQVSSQKTPPPEGSVKIVIDHDTLKLTVYADGKPYKEYPVAIGKSETPSPIGEWRIIHKAVGWGTGFGTRWLGLNVPWGIYGIHGTNKPWSIGTAASHGCFRMFNKHVEEIFPWVKIGTPVIVKGTVHGLSKRPLKVGATGQDVVIVQLKLREEKLLWTPADGRFGPATERALKLYQLLNGLPATGQVDQSTWKLILPEGGRQ